MKILVIGGTRFFGIHMVNELLAKGHNVTIATRGNRSDVFGNRVNRIIIERTNEQSMKTLSSHYDVVIDKIAYCSNDIKYGMETVNCDKYIHMSSTAVYEPKHMNTVESDFDGVSKELVWCDRTDFSYGEIKRQAECALWQKYVEHTMKSIPMDIDNLNSQMGFIRSDEAGKFMAFLVEQDIRGAINGSSEGTISIREIIEYVEQKTGTKAVVDKTGAKAPYNGESEYSINTEKAGVLGFRFSVLQDWIYKLLDYYIQRVN